MDFDPTRQIVTLKDAETIDISRSPKLEAMLDSVAETGRPRPAGWWDWRSGEIEVHFALSAGDDTADIPLASSTERILGFSLLETEETTVLQYQGKLNDPDFEAFIQFLQ